MKFHLWLFPLLTALLICLAAAPFFGCGDDDDDDDNNDTSDDDDDNDDNDNDDPPYPESCPSGTELIFDLSAEPMVVPYPNNLYTVTDPDSATGERVQIDEKTALPMGKLAGMGLFGFVTNAVNALNGFSTAADLYVPIGAMPATHTLPDEFNPALTDSVFVMVNDPDSPWDKEFAPFNLEWKEDTLHLRPAVPLREDTHYLVVVTRDLEPSEGGCYKASESMQAIWTEAQKDVGDKGNPIAYADALDDLEMMGLAPADILSISEFDTLQVTKDLDDVRAYLDQRAQDNPPELTNWEFIASGNPGLQSYANATLVTPIFKNHQGYWVRDENGDLLPDHNEAVNVLLSLPRADAHPDGQPYPLVVYGHGLGDTKDSLKILASLFAQNGFAFAGMDAVCHGDRAPIPGDPASSMLCYFDFLDPLNFRDNLRETIADQMWFVRALKQLGQVDNIPEGGDGIPDFDVNHIYYLSISMGSIHGGVFAALEENIDAWVVSSAGAKFTGIALEGPYLGEFVTIARLLDNIIPNLHSEDMLWLLGGMAQHILDAGDPYNYLPYTYYDSLPSLEGHHPYILQQGAEDDFMLGGLSGAYYCRASGWPQMNPYVWDVNYVEHQSCPYEGSGFYQYNTDEHFWLWLEGEMGDAYREQALHYFRTHLEDGVPEIIDPLAR